MKDKLKAYLESSVWNRIVDRENPEKRRVTRLFLHVGARKLRWFVSATVRTELKRTRNLELRHLLERQLDREHPRTLTFSNRGVRILNDLLDRGIGRTDRIADTFHVAGAIDGGMDYLVSWDVRHLANPRARQVVRAYCREHGYNELWLGTPEEVIAWLIEGQH